MNPDFWKGTPVADHAAGVLARAPRPSSMARGKRLNKVIELLETGQPVFCAAVAQNGDWDGLAQLALSDFDMVIVETEHQGFDLPLCATPCSTCCTAGASRPRAVFSPTSCRSCASRRTRASATSG